MLFSIGAPTKLSSKVKIRIKHKLLNETIKYEVLLWSKVFEIKQRLQLITKIHPKFQRLFYSNKELKNNKALDYYGIKKNSLLLMTLKIKRKDKTFLKV